MDTKMLFVALSYYQFTEEIPYMKSTLFSVILSVTGKSYDCVKQTIPYFATFDTS